MGQLESVKFGVILGTATLLFGIFWAMFLVTQHDGIHNYLGQKTLERQEKIDMLKKKADEMFEKKLLDRRNERKSGESSSLRLVENAYAAGSHEGGHYDDDDDDMKMNDSMADSMHNIDENSENSSHDGHDMDAGGHHNDPETELAHTRLTRGHIHAMGLGLVALVISLLYSFLTVADDKNKLMFTGAIGLGAFIYPFSWIIMGFRTTSLGAEQAELSVMFIVGPAVLLILSGLGSFFYYSCKAAFFSKS